jgi:BolA protein
MRQQIIDLLTVAFSPTTLEVINDSTKHVGHAGSPGSGESHFRIYIVSEAFAGVKPVIRHRMVYEALTPTFAKGVHAVSIRAESGK